MNVLMLDPKRVVVEKGEEPIHRMFESLGIECVKVSDNNGHTVIYYSLFAFTLLVEKLLYITFLILAIFQDFKDQQACDLGLSVLRLVIIMGM